uniref:Choline/carnitine acyltransferase domain-containing protein n=1 Tax=Glossina brevipalpis TaxID=37001 RepID=A0A1A9WDR2_9MUSC
MINEEVQETRGPATMEDISAAPAIGKYLVQITIMAILCTDVRIKAAAERSDGSKEEEFKTGSSKDFESYTKLEFDKPTDSILAQIEKASSNLNALVKNFQLHVMQFKDYEKGLLKKYKLSPDSFIQMALQYAFYRYT